VAHSCQMIEKPSAVSDTSQILSACARLESTCGAAESRAPSQNLLRGSGLPRRLRFRMMRFASGGQQCQQVGGEFADAVEPFATHT
jgi:hypothetical protein